MTDLMVLLALVALAAGIWFLAGRDGLGADSRDGQDWRAPGSPRAPRGRVTPA